MERHKIALRGSRRASGYEAGDYARGQGAMRGIGQGNGGEVDESFLLCDYVRHYEDGKDAELPQHAA